MESYLFLSNDKVPEYLEIKLFKLAWIGYRLSSVLALIGSVGLFSIQHIGSTHWQLTILQVIIYKRKVS